MSEAKIGNWRARIGGYGDVHFWQCSEADAREAAKRKADWEGGGYRLYPMTDAEVVEYESRPYHRWGCYDVGEKPAPPSADPKQEAQV